MTADRGFLHLSVQPAQDYRLSEEDRFGVSWLVARNYNMRFTGTMQLPAEDHDLNGVFLCVENAMLPISNDEVLGYAHGVVSIYNTNQAEIFTGPFLNPSLGMRWQNGDIADYWMELVAAWSGSREFAGRLLQVKLQGRWKDTVSKQLILEGDVTLV
ncbi:MAG TPA: hypothetical protein VJZ27_00680 [Aggregatilineales bacterium]|nr:hypothetical protein [Aggregatilineales bacterium]